MLGACHICRKGARDEPLCILMTCAMLTGASGNARRPWCAAKQPCAHAERCTRQRVPDSRQSPGWRNAGWPHGSAWATRKWPPEQRGGRRLWGAVGGRSLGWSKRAWQVRKACVRRPAGRYRSDRGHDLPIPAGHLFMRGSGLLMRHAELHPRRTVALRRDFGSAAALPQVEVLAAWRIHVVCCVGQARGNIGA